MADLAIHEMIGRTIEYCVSQLGMREMCLDDIGTEKDDVVKFETIDKHFYDAGNKSARFAGFTWEDRYRFLRELGKPEYVLDHIFRLGYIGKRQAGVVVDYYEDELSKTLAALAKKYGKKKFEALKKRLGIVEMGI